MHSTLYGAPGSGSAAIEMALRVVGMPYRVVRAASWEPDSALAELRRVNPLGQIPTLVLADGEVLTESAAILIHLGLADPRSGLLPQAPTERAQAVRGLVYLAANCYSAISVIDHPERWTRSDLAQAREDVRAAATAQLHQHWVVFADTWGARPAFAAAVPGALAFLAVVVSRWSGARGHLRVHRPAFHQALETLDRQPTIAGVLREHGTA